MRFLFRAPLAPPPRHRPRPRPACRFVFRRLPPALAFAFRHVLRPLYYVVALCRIRPGPLRMGRSGPRGPSLYVVKGLCGKPVSYWKRWQISFPHSTYAENEKTFEITHLLVFRIFPHYGQHPNLGITSSRENV